MDRPVMAEVKTLVLHGEGAPPNGSIEEFVPKDPDFFGVTVQVFIGDTASDLVDSFDLIVCSPVWMAAQVEAGAWEMFQMGGLHSMPDSIAVGSGIWLMRRWDRGDLEAALRSVCQTFSPGPDWGSVASRISRLIPWEFADKYDAHVNGRFAQPFPEDPQERHRTG